jgi:hypothetical protein
VTITSSATSTPQHDFTARLAGVAVMNFTTKFNEAAWREIHPF